jgi:serine/threonine protein kinase
MGAIMIDPLSLCMGCMEKKGSGVTCPKCGWEEGTQEGTSCLQPRTVLNDRYLLGRVRGQGGYGITYSAWDLTFEAKRAIKEYFPKSICSRGVDEHTVRLSNRQEKESFEYGVKKFVEEAKALEKLREHPGVVKCFDFFNGNGTAYLVMELMEGRNFLEFLQEHGGKIPFDMTVGILVPVMDALREVHSAGMLHRDLAPDNIFITNNRQVKLFDFGSTRLAIREQTQNLGDHKPGYTPREVYSGGGNQGPWTDIYSLAATMYRALTGQPPPAALDRLDKDLLLPPSRLGVKINHGCEGALLKGLAVRPAARFQTVEEFEQIFLPSVITRQSPSSAPSPSPAPLQAARKPVLVLLALLVLALVFAFALYQNNSGTSLGAKERIAQGDAFKNKGQYEAAIEVYKEAQKLDPLNVDLDEKIKEAERLIKEIPQKPKLPLVVPPVVPNSIVKERIAQGDAFRNKGQYEAAIEVYKEAQKLDPLNADLENKIREVQDALKAEQIIFSNSSSRQPRTSGTDSGQYQIQDDLQKGGDAIKVGNYQEAVARYRSVLAKAPSNSDAQRGLKRAMDAAKAEGSSVR